MRATIDQAGRLVIPKSLRDRVGLGPGEVELVVDGAGLRLQAVAAEDTTMREGRRIIPPSGAVIDDALVRLLRDAGQR